MQFYNSTDVAVLCLSLPELIQRAYYLMGWNRTMLTCAHRLHIDLIIPISMFISVYKMSTMHPAPIHQN
jgi:hypothetical protein